MFSWLQPSQLPAGMEQEVVALDSWISELISVPVHDQISVSQHWFPLGRCSTSDSLRYLGSFLVLDVWCGMTVSTAVTANSIDLLKSST